MADRIKNILVGTVAAGAVFLMIFLGTGNRIYAVQSGSMEPAIQTGSAVLVETKTGLNGIAVGDVICFEAANGTPVIHRAVRVAVEGIETKGDANNVTDGISTTSSNYIGKVLLSIPAAGYILAVLSAAKTKIILLTILAVLIVLTIVKKHNSAGKETEDAQKI